MNERTRPLPCQNQPRRQLPHGPADLRSVPELQRPRTAPSARTLQEALSEAPGATPKGRRAARPASEAPGPSSAARRGTRRRDARPVPAAAPVPPGRPRPPAPPRRGGPIPQGEGERVTPRGTVAARAGRGGCRGGRGRYPRRLLPQPPGRPSPTRQPRLGAGVAPRHTLPPPPPARKRLPRPLEPERQGPAAGRAPRALTTGVPLAGAAAPPRPHARGPASLPIPPPPPGSQGRPGSGTSSAPRRRRRLAPRGGAGRGGGRACGTGGACANGPPGSGALRLRSALRAAGAGPGRRAGLDGRCSSPGGAGGRAPPAAPLRPPTTGAPRGGGWPGASVAAPLPPGPRSALPAGRREGGRRAGRRPGREESWRAPGPGREPPERTPAPGAPSASASQLPAWRPNPLGEKICNEAKSAAHRKPLTPVPGLTQLHGCLHLACLPNEAATDLHVLQLTQEQPPTSASSCITNLTLHRYPPSLPLWNTRKWRNTLDATSGDLCQETHLHLSAHPVYSDVKRNFVFFVSCNADFCYVKHLHNLNLFQDSSSTRRFVSVRSRPIHSHSLKHNPWDTGRINTVAACHLLHLFT
ncbi:translation initiation factor IF-2-like [Falco biarmicus]|uniref:translation initiation factor IF-2-like n=1 Tax=Falco biarmicus TaxID=345155 RepID=UPI0024BBEFAA|nr:translation initiation factor IF-2-like [Falco biarmicus]